MGEFFNSWELWEKFTFILGAAIVAVFCMGFAKVAWQNRYLKKHRLVDEEKRAKIQELRKSGQFVEPRQSKEIPFGVRAIQSGVQVDGIWISGNNTPVPVDLQAGCYSGKSSDVTAGPSNQQHPGKKLPRSMNDQSRSSTKSTVSNERTLPTSSRKARQYSTTETMTSTIPSGYNGSYKPRRSSHLRFGSYGDTKYDHDTLAQLEGKAKLDRSEDKTHQPESVPTDDKGVDSSSGHGADNEASSSDSDVSFHNASESRQQGLIRISSLQQNSPKLIISSTASHQAPQQAQFLRDGYISVPLDDLEKLSAHSSKDASPSKTPSTEISQTVPVELPGRFRPSVEVPLLSQPQAVPRPRRESFTPGDIHINRTSRVVNSGFEVLPAGTFGTPTEFQSNEDGRGQNWQQQQMGDQKDGKQSKRLSKKRRASLSLGQRSTIIDRS
ncbi:hypothetical protein PVAG01_01521 [Phlyctema vagabunda]|uniref:Uncharacterized protein n=1 Tax=Phlyctema vagabunda TaxID=108571 RepID=A0ABR4PXD5_9HELO